MAENLNYETPTGSYCYGEGGTNNVSSTYGGFYTLTSQQIAENCKKYGRLYSWAIAMDLPSSCNSSSCKNQINTPHQGICPEGWHIPTDKEWVVLVEYAGGSSTAGNKLKAKVGWNYNEEEDKLGNGTDNYGFAALPGGYSIGGNFSAVGTFGFWWEVNESSTNSAWFSYMSYKRENVAWNEDYKTRRQSVRCLRD